MLRGVSNDYIYVIDPFFVPPAIPKRKVVRRETDLSAFKYKDLACAKVRETGFARCTDCPLPYCDIRTADIVRRVADV